MSKYRNCFLIYFRNSDTYGAPQAPLAAPVATSYPSFPTQEQVSYSEPTYLPAQGK